jgi:cytochrome c-type biogenesis protein
MASFWLLAASALWLGILTSISPCPLATNIAAVAYVGRRVGRTSAVLASGVLYTAGRALTYTVLGAAAVWSLMSMVGVSSFLQGAFHRALGPLLIVVGLMLLEVVTIRMGGGSPGERMRERVDGWGIWGALLLGVVFAASFCPVSAGLFFGSLIPMAADHGSPILLPLLFGVGTALPVAAFALLLAAGAGWLSKALGRVQVFERWARRATAAVFILVGVYETLRSTFLLF